MATTRPLQLGGLLLIAAALVACEAVGPPMKGAGAGLAPVLHPGAAPREVAAPAAWSGHALEPDVAHLLIPPSTGGGGGGGTPPATQPPADPPAAVPGADLTPPADCCGCFSGLDGWGWMVRSAGVCGASGAIVPGLCGCAYGNGRWHPYPC
jgi:hypothetical protein